MKIFLGFLFDYLILFITAKIIKISIELDWNSWQVFLALILLHLILSFKSLDAQRIGGVLFFGAFAKDVKPGFILVPAFSCRLVSETALIMQRQFPGEPEEIDKSGKDTPEEGKVMPIRITHAEIEDSNDPLDKRITTEPTFFVSYQIVDFEAFYTNIGSSEEAERQMRDTGESEVRVKFSALTARQTNEQQSDLNNGLMESIENLVETWGVKIKRVGIMLNFNHELNKAMAGVGQAAYDKKSTIITAEGEKQKLILEGTGTAKAEELFLKARAIGYQKIAEELGIDDKAFVLQMETLKKALETSQHTIIPGSEEFKLLSGLKQVFSKS